ncbi:hypothetical protein H5T87_01110 [bacterium]|nr:hypothetical protein [bacterium]
MNPHKIASSTVGLIVFVVGIGLLIYTFALAFSSLSHPITFTQPAEVTSYLLGLLKSIAYLLVMGLCATLVAVMGLKMFHSG